MSLTVATIITDFNTYVGDSSNDRVSAAQRLEFVTEAVIWLQEELKNDHMIRTYPLEFLDTINYYEVTTPLADLLEGADLRRSIGKNYHSMAHKSPRELAEEVAQGIIGDDSWAVERRDNDVYLVVNATPQNRATLLDDFDSGTTDWEADTTTSDATNVTIDTNEFFQGSSSINFDIDVSQSVNNKAGLVNDDVQLDLSSLEDTGVFLINAFIPDVTLITSYTLRWGTDSSNYWTTTVTTDIDGNAFVSAKWLTLAFDWLGSTTVGTPDSSDIAYFRIDMNYSAGQTDDTDFRYDYFRVAKPETLTFHYASFIVGEDNAGADIYKFAATTDVPYFSGKYDQYRKAVAHMASSLAFDTLRLKDDAIKEETRAFKALERARRIYEQSITKPMKSFKVQGINLARPARINNRRSV